MVLFLLETGNTKMNKTWSLLIINLTGGRKKPKDIGSLIYFGIDMHGMRWEPDEWPIRRGVAYILGEEG